MGPIDRFIRWLAKAMALLGGAVLIALIAATCLSIAGRLLNTLGHSTVIAQLLPSLASPLQAIGPVTGDFELVEAGIAFAIMAFIPWCHLERRHASVAVFTKALPAAFDRWLSLLWDVLFAAAFALIAWRLVAGTLDKMRYGETTFMLQFPVWWAYLAVTMAALGLCLVAFWSVVIQAREALGMGALHPPRSGTA